VTYMGRPCRVVGTGARARLEADSSGARAQSRAAALMQRAGSGGSVDSTTAALFAEARARFLADRAALAESAVRAVAASSPRVASAASTPRQSVTSRSGSGAGADAGRNPASDPAQAARGGRSPAELSREQASPFEMPETPGAGEGAAAVPLQRAGGSGAGQARPAPAQMAGESCRMALASATQRPSLTRCWPGHRRRRPMGWRRARRRALVRQRLRVRQAPLRSGPPRSRAGARPPAAAGSCPCSSAARPRPRRASGGAAPAGRARVRRARRARAAARRLRIGPCSERGPPAPRRGPSFLCDPVRSCLWAGCASTVGALSADAARNRFFLDCCLGAGGHVTREAVTEMLVVIWFHSCSRGLFPGSGLG